MTKNTISKTCSWRIRAIEVVAHGRRKPVLLDCKTTSLRGTKVAGIISTSPGVVLGNDFDEATDDWEDNRPVLSVTGRVPRKVSDENSPIQIGDLLVASFTPGIAIKGTPERAIGAVVGKAMEPLEDREGTIVVQVMLR